MENAPVDSGSTDVNETRRDVWRTEIPRARVQRRDEGRGDTKGEDEMRREDTLGRGGTDVILKRGGCLNTWDPAVRRG